MYWHHSSRMQNVRKLYSTNVRCEGRQEADRLIPFQVCVRVVSWGGNW